MMSFALMGCLIIGASDASAQGRSRSQGGSTTNRSQSAAVSRNNNSATAPTVSRSTGSSASSSSRTSSAVNRSSSSSSVSRSTSATPQVNRSTSSSSSSRSTSMTTVPQVNRGSNDNKSTGRGSGTRTGNATNRGGSSTTVRGGNTGSNSTSTTTITRRSDSGSSISPVSTKTDLNEGKITTTRGTTTKPNGNRPGGNGGNIDNGRDKGNRGGNGGNIDNGRRGGKPGNDRPGNIDTGNKDPKPGNGNLDKGRRGDKNGKRPGGNGRPGGGSGYNPDHHFDYSSHHYRDDFHRNYTHHNWSRPLPPPVRRYRPAPLVWYRPVIPSGWYPYATAPVIDRILGITFGTLFDTSLEYLYYNGYEIDGYADHIIYLRNVPLLNLTWSDVMLCYDSMDRLVNAQFIFYSTHNDRNRYDRVYNSLCRVYGLPFNNSNDGLSWYGGSNTGWVTLTRHSNLGHYYTTLSIGY